MRMSYRILSINPGSTSTKIGVFEDGRELLSANVAHDADALAGFPTISAQLPYRKETILRALSDAGIDLSSMDAFVGRGGGLLPVEGGVYTINSTLLDHATRGANGVQHPAQLGPQLAHGFAREYGKPCFVVNPPDTDELALRARITGVRGMYRTVHLHALNLKETAIRHSAALGKRYEDCNYVVCHIGGGISISAHEKGRMIDGNDIVGGEGPMAPTRCGALPAAGLMDYCQRHDVKTARALCTRTGGFISHLGTADAKAIFERAEAGDAYARVVWDAMCYQIVKYIGAMAAALMGKVDGILLGGGMVRNQALVRAIEEGCGWIAPVTAYPGEFELEAMAAGACRVLSGQERAKEYTGLPVWTPGEWERQA